MINLVTTITLLLAAAPPADAEIKADRSYFLISFRGRTIGKAERVIISEEVEGRKRLTLAVKEHFRFSTGNRPAAESSSVRVVVMHPDWTPISVAESSTAGGRTRKTSVEIHPGKAVFTLPGGRKREVAYKGKLVAEMNGRALAARGLLAVGKKLTAAVPDLAQGGIVLVRAEVIGARTVEGRKGKLFLVGVKAAGGKQEWDLLVDESGRLVEQSVGDMVRKRVAASKAVLPDRPAALRAGVVPLAGAPPRFWKLESMTVVLEIPEVTRGLVPELAGQKVVEAGRRLTVKLVARQPNGLLPQEKLTGKDRARWLTPEKEPDWRDPQIRKLAAVITREEKGDLRRGYLIGKWVYRNLVKSLGGPPEASARQALKSGSGDCSEHAALFAALSRAANIPARTAYGLAGARGALRFHVWSEYYADGRWVPLDAAIGRYGLPACYLTLSYDREAGGARLFKLYASAKGRVTDYKERPARSRSR